MTGGINPIRRAGQELPSRFDPVRRLCLGYDGIKPVLSCESWTSALARRVLW
jgi:hypothetical protein